MEAQVDRRGDGPSAVGGVSRQSPGLDRCVRCLLIGCRSTRLSRTEMFNSGATLLAAAHLLQRDAANPDSTRKC